MTDSAAGPPGLPRDDFVGFYRAYSERILRFFARRVYDAQVALDLTSETFAAAYGARKGISYSVWRKSGVPAAVLKKAGISRSA